MRATSLLLITLLAGCAGAPQVADIPVPVPCPKKPTMERPALEDIPQDAAYDHIAVIVKRNFLRLFGYIEQLEKAEGCK